MRNRVARLVREIDPGLVRSVASVIIDAASRGQRVFLFGNGGSSALAAHFASDLLGCSVASRTSRPLRAFSIADGGASLTAMANDFGFAKSFELQLDTHIEAGDVAIGISCSGRSPNVINALRVAIARGAVTIGLTGRTGLPMVSTCAFCYQVNSVHVFEIESAHACFTHLVTAVLRAVLRSGQPVLPERSREPLARQRRRQSIK